MINFDDLTKENIKHYNIKLATNSWSSLQIINNLRLCLGSKDWEMLQLDIKPTKLLSEFRSKIK